MTAQNLFGLKGEQRPKWLPQVMQRIERVAQHDPGAKAFLVDVAAYEAEVATQAKAAASTTASATTVVSASNAVGIPVTASAPVSASTSTTETAESAKTSQAVRPTVQAD